MIGAVLDGLLSGGNATHVTGLSTVTDEVAPTAAELAANLRTVLSLVAAPSTSLATRALKWLIAVDAETPLDADTIGAAAGVALGLTSKQAATAALGWLRKAARRDTFDLDVLAEAAARGLGHQSRDVQERSLTLIESLADRLTDAGRAEVAAWADGLDESLTARARALGLSEEAEPVGFTGPADLLPELPPPPARVATLAEFVEELNRARQHGSGQDERLLDGAAMFGHQHEVLAQGLSLLVGEQDLIELWDGVAANPIIRHLLPPPRRLWDAGSEKWVAARKPKGGRYEAGGLAAVPNLRADEVRQRLARPQRLLATPDTGSGHVDPERIAFDLTAAARDGHRFGTLDVEQAWLRLPTRPWDDRLGQRLLAIGSADAGWIGERVARGPLPSPRASLRWHTYSRTTAITLVADLDYSAIVGAGGQILRRVATYPEDGWVIGYATMAVVPSLREATAGLCTRRLVNLSGITMLPHLHGPSGMATALAIAKAATWQERAWRTAATDAVLGFVALDATPDRLDPWLLGRVMADLLDDAQTKLGRWHEVLDTVERTGLASRYVALVLQPLLEVALTRPDAEAIAKRPGFADLLELTTRAVRNSEVRFGLPGLDALAERGGTSRAVTEAVRLRNALFR